MSTDTPKESKHVKFPDWAPPPDPSSGPRNHPREVKGGSPNQDAYRGRPDLSDREAEEARDRREEAPNLPPDERGLLRVMDLVPGWIMRAIKKAIKPEIVHAGNGFWSPTACWGIAPHYGQWYGVQGVGCWFYCPYYDSAAHLVQGRIYQRHTLLRAECGAQAGFPISDQWSSAEGRAQYFRSPAAYRNLNYILDYNDGRLQHYTVINYFPAS